MYKGTAEFLRIVKNPWKFRLFLLTKLPSAYFSGVRVKSVTEQECEVVVPFKWFTQNPFRSTYFACLAMAAELSTGALAMANVYKRRPAVSMLVVDMHAEYFKKATGKTWFTCRDGELFKEMIEQSLTTGEAVTIKARSEGKNASGETVASFVITWSFKARTEKPV